MSAVDGTPYGTSRALTGGTALVKVLLDTPGEHDLFVSYRPASGSWLPTATEVGWSADTPTTVAVSVDPEHPVAGEPFEATITVSSSFGGTPAGSVDVGVGAGEPVTSPIHSGEATITDLVVPTAGPAQLTVAFSPAVGWAGSSVVVTLQVDAAAVVVEMDRPPGSATYGATATWEAQVATSSGDPLSSGSTVIWARPSQLDQAPLMR